MMPGALSGCTETARSWADATTLWHPRRLLGQSGAVDCRQVRDAPAEILTLPGTTPGIRGSRRPQRWEYLDAPHSPMREVVDQARRDSHHQDPSGSEWPGVRTAVEPA